MYANFRMFGGNGSENKNNLNVSANHPLRYFSTKISEDGIPCLNSIANVKENLDGKVIRNLKNADII